MNIVRNILVGGLMVLVSSCTFALGAEDLSGALVDAKTSQLTREKVERMPVAEAAKMLRDALTKATGNTRAGIIDSLGAIRDRESVTAVAALVSDANAVVACSAATALGRIGGADALAALKASYAKPGAAPKPAVAAAMLTLAEADAKAAPAIYSELYNSDLPEHLRTAAYIGMIASAGDGAAELIAKGLAGSEKSATLASLKMAGKTKGEGVTRAAADALGKAVPDVQAALIDVLAQRGDVAARAAVTAAASSKTPQVRVAALRALGVLGDATAMNVLPQAAAGPDGPERVAAREALGRIRGQNVGEAMISQLATAEPAVKLELVRALASRPGPAVTAALITAAGDANEAVRVASLQSLADVADPSAVGELVKLVVQAKTEGERGEAEKALIGACNRAADKASCAAPVLAGMKGAAAPARASLLGVCGSLGGGEPLAALREALKEKDPVIKDAAVRGLSSTRDASAAGDLLALMKDESNLTHRVLALRGAVRLLGEAKLPPEQASSILKAAASAAAGRDDDKRLVLGAAGSLGRLEAIAVIEPFLEDKNVRKEALNALLQTAKAIAETNPKEAFEAASKVAAGSPDRAVKGEAQALAGKLSPKVK